MENNKFERFRFFLLALLVCGCSAQAATLSLVPASTTVAPGSSVAVAVVISGLGDGIAESLSSYDIGIIFDSSVLLSESLVFGGQLDFGSGSFTLVDGATSGVLSVLEISFESVATLNSLQAPEFTLFTISFNALQPGSSVLSFGNLVLGDAAGNPLSIATAGATINVVPLPAGAVLFPSALLGLAWFRRKRSAR